MMLSDREIKGLIDDGVLNNADVTRVGPVSYDLRTREFYFGDSGRSRECSLMPGDSTFVGSEETIALPSNMTARVLLKNSRIRQGLTLEAPLYFPGHGTRVFFRITNVLAGEISLASGNDIAQVAFERLDAPAMAPYQGTFSDEFDFRDLGSYSDVYAAQRRGLERATDRIEDVEQRLYGNVMAIMGIFVAIFTLVNVNATWLAEHMPASSAIVLNLSAVGATVALVGLVSLVTDARGAAARRVPWIVSAVSFIAAAILFFLAG